MEKWIVFSVRKHTKSWAGPGNKANKTLVQFLLTTICHAFPHTQGRQIGTQDLEEMGQCFCTALHHLETHPSPEGPSDREDNGTAQNKEAIAEQPQMSDSESNGYVIIVT